MKTDNIEQLECWILVALPRDRPPTEEEVHELARSLRRAAPVSDEEFDELIRRVHAKVAITMNLGSALIADHRPWLLARKPEITPFYWERFGRLLAQENWPPLVVATLDRVTDDILDLLGDPLTSAPWSRRGLVVGDVQSGKTATYTALTCKAGDAGYRLIILLTGTLESLRRQTQERMDEGFVGLDSSGELTAVPNRREVGVGRLDGRKMGWVFTSRLSDFDKRRVNAQGARLDGLQVPALVVVKKNKKILENLEKWLREFNADASGSISTPVLIIDDEADNASVNTRKPDEDPTEINKRIRSLLKLFTHASYVGFTATPFANVFINPDTEDEMLGSDLFPKDFIYNLEPPSNYFGPQRVFGDEPLASVLRTIADADVVFPEKHKADLKVDGLPESLITALQSFLLATTIRDVRGEGPSHRSMLINVSRFTAAQDQVANHVQAWLSQVQQDIRNYSQLTEAEALRNQTIAGLHSTWSQEYSTLGTSWRSVQLALLEGALPVVVKAVNQRTGAAALDYAKHREHGLRVIAVGGNSLSRGLTLYGLSTSYFYRNSQMYDTLLQMGRWFGYRDGYEDLCRIWLSDDAVQWYSHITAATEELRVEFYKMQQAGGTPADFGLKVRAHPDSLIVTARNKMRHTQVIEREVAISNQYLETPRLKRNPNILKANHDVAKNFVSRLLDEYDTIRSTSYGNPFWSGLPKEMVAEVVRGFDVHPLNVSFQTKDLAAFIESTQEALLETWDVVLPQGEGQPHPIKALTLGLNQRDVTWDDSILVSGRHLRVASRGIERTGLHPELVTSLVEEYGQSDPGKNIPDERFRRRRPRPLLIIHFVEPRTAPPKGGMPEVPLVAIGLSFPPCDDSAFATRVKYVVNLVELRSMLEAVSDEDQEPEETLDAD